MNATNSGGVPVRDGVYTRAAGSRQRRENTRDACRYLKRVRHLFSRGFVCFAADSETRVDADTARDLCLTRRHRECSLFKAHEAAQRRRP